MTTTTPMATDQDAALIARLTARDEQALASLYDRHAHIAFSLAYRIAGDREVAEEVVQEAFLSVWRRAASYQPGRGTVRGWLLAIVRNRAIDTVRAREARPRTTVIDELPLAAADDPEREALAALDGYVIRAAVATLPADQRIVIDLTYFGGLTGPEIAARLDVPLGTVKSRLRLALSRLRDHLAEALPAATPIPVHQTVAEVPPPTGRAPLSVNLRAYGGGLLHPAAAR